jgi:hypothetical protein
MVKALFILGRDNWWSLRDYQPVLGGGSGSGCLIVEPGKRIKPVMKIDR